MRSSNDLSFYKYEHIVYCHENTEKLFALFGWLCVLFIKKTCATQHHAKNTKQSFRFVNLCYIKIYYMFTCFLSATAYRAHDWKLYMCLMFIKLCCGNKKKLWKYIHSAVDSVSFFAKKKINYNCWTNETIFTHSSSLYRCHLCTVTLTTKPILRIYFIFICMSMYFMYVKVNALISNNMKEN